MSLPHAVVFDLDGTLIDSVPDVAVSLNFALERTGAEALSLESVKSMVGQGAAAMIKKALALIEYPHDQDHCDRVLKRFVAWYSAHPCDHSSVYPGVLEVLDGLRAEGVNMGICTNKPLATTTPVLSALNMQDYFSAVLCGDQVAHQKPDKRHVFKTLEKMGAEPDKAILVGDSANDIVAAQNAGLPSVAVAWGYSQGPALELGADALIDDFALLPKTLKRLLARDTNKLNK
jgi:phosphoglycolate phosphatase